MAKRSQKISKTSYPPPRSVNRPAVSVIIPLYNVEKYIGECLDSLLAQTFQNFEVIVVDDCSTDSSPAIVESYAPKFDGRLRLERMIKKSKGGGGSIPRNVGFEFSRGEYIFFFDADDTITPTALEELYSLAKKFDADVVHCEKFYAVPDQLWNNAEYRKQLKPVNYLTGEKIFVTEPLIWEDNFEERIKFLRSKKLIWNIWAQLIRRDFILRNEIKMPDAVAQDMTFTICELCSAKKYVVVPNVVNFYRVRQNSVSSEQINARQLIKKWLRSVQHGVRYLDKFLGDNEFFARRPDLKYTVFDAFVSEMSSHLLGIYARVPAPALDELLRKEFADGDNVALMSFIFSFMNVQRIQQLQTQLKVNQFAAQAN